MLPLLRSTNTSSEEKGEEKVNMKTGRGNGKIGTAKQEGRSLGDMKTKASVV